MKGEPRGRPTWRWLSPVERQRRDDGFLRMYEREGLSQREIARALGFSKHTVQMGIKSAKTNGLGGE